MKKLFYQSIIFITIILLGQVIIGQYMIAQISQIALLEKYLRNKTQIIYFGDSIIKTTEKKDLDNSSIVEMLSKINPNYTIGDFSDGGNYMRIFEAYIKYISKSPNKPGAVIIPINLYFFSPGRNMEPGFQFEKEIFYFTAPHFATYFFRPLAIFGAINLNTVKRPEYLQLPVYYGKEKIGVVSDFDNSNSNATTTENLRNLYIFEFMYNLDKNHRQLKELDNIIDLTNKSGIKLYVYITPIDFKNGERYVGADLAKQITANAQTVCSILEEKNLPCLNLSLSLDSSYFSHLIYPNEHVNEKGRRFIAEQINNFFLK